MEQNRSPRGRVTLLDVVLGVLIALPIQGIADHLRTIAAVQTVDSIGRLAFLAGVLFFAAFYWLEMNPLFRSLDRLSDGTPGSPADSRGGPSALLVSVKLVTVALLGVAISLASVETAGWFLGVNAVFWAFDLGAVIVLRQRSRAHAPAGATGAGSKALSSLLTSSAVNLVAFAVPAAWNMAAPWGERMRSIAGIAFLAWVLVSHLAWRYRSAAEAAR